MKSIRLLCMSLITLFFNSPCMETQTADQLYDDNVAYVEHYVTNTNQLFDEFFLLDLRNMYQAINQQDAILGARFIATIFPIFTDPANAERYSSKTVQKATIGWLLSLKAKRLKPEPVPLPL